MTLYFLGLENIAYSMMESMEEQKEVIISKGIKPAEGVKREMSTKSKLNTKKSAYLTFKNNGELKILEELEEQTINKVTSMLLVVSDINNNKQQK